MGVQQRQRRSPLILPAAGDEADCRHNDCASAAGGPTPLTPINVPYPGDVRQPAAAASDRRARLLHARVGRRPWTDQRFSWLTGFQLFSQRVRSRLGWLDPPKAILNCSAALRPLVSQHLPSAVTVKYN